MNITALNGNELTITDLPIATMMRADNYRRYRVTAPNDRDLYCFKYWEDISQKLLYKYGINSDL
jgi:hypothetical protein